MKKLFKFILLLTLPFLLPKISFGQTGVQWLGTKDNVVVTRNIAREDSAHEFALTDTSKHPARPGRMISFNGSPYWWNGIFWYRLNGDTSTVPGQVNADWTATTGVALILHKPTFATVATTGSYTDLINPPTIPAAQVAVDWNAASGITHILNKPRITDSIWRVIGKDSILFRIVGPDGVVRNYSILDSAGGAGGGGGGTVFSVAAANLTPLFSTNVATATTNPSITFTLNNAAAHTFFGNNTGSTGPPTYSTIGLGDLPTIPLTKTDVTNGIGISAIVSGVIKVDTSVIGYPKFISISRSPNTDSVYYTVKTNAATTVKTLGLIDSVRYTSIGLAGTTNLGYQTGPSSFYTRKVRPGTNTAFTADTDSTLVIASTLTNVINTLQVINSGAARSIQVGTFSGRPTGNTGDFYVVSDSSYRESYKTASGWIWMTVSPKQLADSFAIVDTVKIAHVAPISNLYTNSNGTTIVDVGSRQGWGMLITKLTDSSNQYMVDSNAIKVLVGSGVTSSVQSQFSVSGNGTSANKLQLVNDSAAGPNYAYYRNSAGRLGWYPIINGPLATPSSPGFLSANDYITIHTRITAINAPGSGDSLMYAVPTADTLVTKRIIKGYGLLATVTQNNIKYDVDTTTLKAVFGAGSGSGLGTVTSFSSGNLNPLFTTSVATATTTPTQTFTLSNAGPYMVFGNNSGSTTTPSYFTPILASLLYQNQGTTTTLLHGNGVGAPSWSTLNLASEVSNVLGTTNGGTNISSYALGDIIYSNGTNSLAKLAGNVTTGKQVLIQTGNGSISAAPVWGNLTNVDVGLGNVENTALSTWSGSTNITTLGTIGTGVWNGTIIDAVRGGTGHGSYTIGDVLVANSTTTLGLVSDVAAGNVFLSGGVGAQPTYGKVNLGTMITGNLPVANLNNGSGASASTVWTGNGTWQPFNTTLYSGDGTLASNRTVTMASNSLTFTGGSKVTFNQAVQIADGTQGTSKVFTSDASGNGAWGLVIASGVYTPTITNSTNVASSTFSSAFYKRIGNVVEVTITFGMVCTTAGVPTTITFTTPPGLTGVWSSSTSFLGIGSYGVNGVYTPGVAIFSGTSGGIVAFQCNGLSGSSNSGCIKFTYSLI